MPIFEMEKRQQGHVVQYRLTNPPYTVVKVRQDTSFVDGLGGEVWNGAFVLIQHLESENYKTQLVHGSRVVELGSGCGLCGLVASALGASHVLLTDEFPDLLIQNIALNSDWIASEKSISSDELIWGNLSLCQLKKIGPVDLVLGSEITQLGKSLHEPLLNTMIQLVQQQSDAICLISMDICSPCCRGNCDIMQCSLSHFICIAEDHFDILMYNPVLLNEIEAVKNRVDAFGRRVRVDNDDFSVVLELKLL